MPNTAMQGLPIPDPNVGNDVPADLELLAKAIEKKLVQQYATVAARDAANPTPGNGEVCFITSENAYFVRSAGVWSHLITAGAWIPYTPSLAGVTLGNGSVEGRYQIVGKTVHFTARLLIGSTTVFTANLQVGVPIPARTVNHGVFAGYRGSPNGIVGCRFATTSAFYVYDAATNQTWGTGTTAGDLRVSGTYEIA